MLGEWSGFREFRWLNGLRELPDFLLPRELGTLLALPLLRPFRGRGRGYILVAVADS